MKNKKEEVSIFHLLNKYIKPLRKHIALLVVLTLMTTFFLTLQPIIISGIMEIVLKAKGESLALFDLKKDDLKSSSKIFDLNQIGNRIEKIVYQHIYTDKKSFWPALWIMAIIFIVTVLLSSFINYMALLMSKWIQTKSTQNIRNDLVTHLLFLDIDYFHKRKTGDMVSRIIQDSRNTAQGLGPLIRSFLHQGSLIVIYSVYLFSTSMWLTLGSIGLIFLQFGITALIKRPIRRTVKNVFVKIGLLTATLQETFINIRVIKSFCAEKHELKKLKRDIELSRSANFKEGAIRGVELPSREFLDSFAIIGILLIATLQLINGSISIQGFILFIYVGRLLITPINKFSVNVTWTQALLASYERLNEIFIQNAKINNGELKIDGFHHNVVLDRISFSYDHDTILNNISLTLKKGEVIAIVGSSGAGKSTLTDLILRLYDPIRGNITIDGTNIKKFGVSSYRKLFGVVPQESLLFNDTISNNIRYCRDNISEKDIIKAAKIANAHDFIKQQPNSYQTQVGDRGVLLSGGQRQRIAIARAIVSKPEILILDEATSSLDTESEKQVQTAIDHILKNSTAIVIAHRLSTIMYADKIVVLNNGKIEAVGKHKELLKRSKTYNKFYKLQFTSVDSRKK